MQIDVVNTAGDVVAKQELDETVWGIEPNIPVMHQALLRQQANARLGTADTKTRAEVRGGGRKPWRQKGTGRARQGSIRSPVAGRRCCLRTAPAQLHPGVASPDARSRHPVGAFGQVP